MTSAGGGFVSFLRGRKKYEPKLTLTVSAIPQY